MFDINATLKWVTAVLTDPNAAAASYREASASWQQSALQLTVPLYVAAFVVAAVLALITGGSLLMGSLSFNVLIFSILWSIGWTFVIAFIFDFLSGTFGGKRNFDAAYGTVALAIVPAAAGAAIAPLPWLGWLISLAASIYSLVLAYRFLPVFLEIPETARVKHFVVSIIAALVINILVISVFGSVFAPSMMNQGTMGTSSSPSPVSTGVFGGLERQADFAEAAANDTYQPPVDGELTRAQVGNYVATLEKTRELKDRLSKSLEGMEDKEPSLTDVFSGVGDAIRLSTAEMEVVKTAGGNWAEHQWVKAQLETARIQKDLNETTAHNYGLFQEFQSEIERLE